MIKILSGLFPPEAGEVHVLGRKVVLTSPRHAMRLGIGTIFQELTLLPAMTVAENLLIVMSHAGPGLSIEARRSTTGLELLHERGISNIEPAGTGGSALILSNGKSLRSSRSSRASRDPVHG